MKTSIVVRVLGHVGVVCFAVSALGCDTEPATASVVNAFPADSASTIVKVWYRTTLFTEAIAPGEESEQKPVGTGNEPAYALIALDYDAEAAAASRLVVARTRNSIDTQNDDQVRLVFSTDSAIGPCVDGSSMTQEEYESIAQRIFPGDTVEAFGAVECGGDAAGSVGAP